MFAVAENCAHVPQRPWEIGVVTAPLATQSIDSEADATDLAVDTGGGVCKRR